MTCPRTGKQQYTKKQAIRQAGWWRRYWFAVMWAYKCRHCGTYHIGNRRP